MYLTGNNLKVRNWVFSIPKRLRIYFLEDKINDAVIENMLSWRHSGFHVYIGDRITPSDKTGLGNLARYIIRACFSQERMIYVPAGESTDGIAQ